MAKGAMNQVEFQSTHSIKSETNRFIFFVLDNRISIHSLNKE